MKENPISARSKAWLEKSLLDLMKDNPYDSISITEICKNSDLTRPTFYQHFSSKDEVIVVYLDTLFDEFYNELKNNEVSSLYELALLFFEFWKVYHSFITLLEKNNLFDLLGKQFIKYLDILFETIQLEPKAIPVNQRVYANAFISGGLIGLLRRWIDNGCKEDASQLASFVEILFN